MLVYIFLFYILYIQLGFTVTSAALFSLPTMDPVFADLHVIRGSYQSLLNSYDPYVFNPYDPWDRLYNYPPIWIYLLGPFLNYTSVYIIGLFLIFLFLIAVYKFVGRLTMWQGFISGFIIASPITFMIFERGNIDIIIFLIIIVSLQAFTQSYRYKSVVIGLIIIFLSILKLYPIVCLFYVDKNKHVYYYIVFITIIFFGFYIISILPYIEAISENTPMSDIRSFGSAILPSIIMDMFKFKTSGNYSIIALAIGSFLYLLLFICIFKLVKNKGVKTMNRSKNLIAFQLGSLIYLGTFALGNNWDYRLIFLILLLPQLFEWYERKYFNMNFMVVLFAVIILQFNFVMISYENHYRTLTINELISWITVGMLLYTYLHTFPEWLNKKLLYTNLSKGN
jgi:hypothetical protein